MPQAKKMFENRLCNISDKVVDGVAGTELFKEFVTSLLDDLVTDVVVKESLGTDEKIP